MNALHSALHISYHLCGVSASELYPIGIKNEGKRVRGEILAYMLEYVASVGKLCEFDLVVMVHKARAEVSDLLSAVPHREGGYDLMAANIVSDILLRLAPAAPAYLKRGGLLAVSGILSERADEVRDGIAAAGFAFLREKREGDWFAMLFGRV